MLLRNRRSTAASALPASGLGVADVPALDAGEIFARFESSPDGLSSEAAHARLRRAGANELPRPRPPHPARLLAAQVTHTLALLLWAGGGLAFLAGLPQLGLAILAIVAINAAFSFWQEYRASRLVEALHQRLPAAVRVRRDGIEQRIPARELVPGDVLIVRRGDRVAADARLFRAADLRADQSSLTGESEPVERTVTTTQAGPLLDAPNCVLAGTTVVDGSGEGIVVATGRATAFGKVAELTERVYLEPSPLQRELATTARVIAVVAVSIGLVFFLAGTFTERLSTRESFIFGVGILVAIVPEGLLPTVTLSLALAVQRMGRHHAIVKRLSSVEALGSTSVICVDKTGTITENEMTARRLWAGDARYRVTGRGYRLRGRLREEGDGGRSERPELTWLLRCAVLCNDGIPPEPHRHRAGVGDPLDEALLVLAMKGGVDPDRERREWSRLREFPFHAARRRMATLHEHRGRRVLFVKGGPLEMLGVCAGELLEGDVRPLTPARREELLGRVDAMSDRGLRVLAFAYREVADPAWVADADAAERELVLLGLVGLDNPVRPEVSSAVGRCRSAGIQE